MFSAKWTTIRRKVKIKNYWLIYENNFLQFIIVATLSILFSLLEEFGFFFEDFVGKKLKQFLYGKLIKKRWTE